MPVSTVPVLLSMATPVLGLVFVAGIVRPPCVTTRFVSAFVREAFSP